MRPLFLFLFLTGTLCGQSVKENVKSLLDNAPELTEKGIKTKSPGKVIDAKIGYFGTLAFLQFEDRRHLGLYNLSKCKFEKFLTLRSASYTFAVGADILVVMYPDINEIEVWDVTSFKVIERGKIKLDSGFLTHIEMAVASKSKAIVSGALTGGDLDSRFYGTMDLTTFTVKKFTNKYMISLRSYRDQPIFRPDISFKNTLVSGSGYQVVDMKESKVTSRGSCWGAANFTHNGKYIICTDGRICEYNGKEIKHDRNTAFFPILGSDFYIEYGASLNKRLKSPPKIHIKNINTHEIKNTFTSPMILLSYKIVNAMRDRVVIASKISNRVIFIDNDTEYVHALNLGLK